LKQNPSRIRVGAVSYLNTVPLVWGMLHGDQRRQVHLSFSIPSQCARQIESGEIDVGLVPVAEIARQNLPIVSDVGIACFGPVRSILLVSRVPWHSVKTLAADASSRTSVQLARVVLAERFGVTPLIAEHEPVLDDMLSRADAALVIGDPALRIQPEQLPYECLDLGEEWRKLTGSPMVFAAWASQHEQPAMQAIAHASYEYGRGRLEEIIDAEHTCRQISRELAETYLRQYIRFQLGREEMEGLRAFLELAHLMKDSHVFATARG
jgi:predicted solute-binding protein